MALDYERKSEKEIEVKKYIEESLFSNGLSKIASPAASSLIFDKSIQITPPEKEDHVMYLMTMSPSGRGGGKSRKLGNIKLNINMLFQAFANGAFAISGASQTPLLIPMAFLILWASFRNVTELNLTENDAGIIWAMWVYRDKTMNEIPNAGLLEVINSHFNKNGRTPITQNDLNHSLQNLVTIRSIKKSKSTTDNWWLCEWIRSNYK